MDPTYLLELTGGDRKVAREIVDDFLVSDVRDRAALADAMRGARASDIQLQAHRIKGAARAIGADSYAALAAAVENAAPGRADVTAEVAALEEGARTLSTWAAGFA